MVANRIGDTANKALESHSRFVMTKLKQPINEYIKSHQPDIKPDQIEKTDLQRNSFLQNFQDHRVKIAVPGNCTLQCGQIINLKVISPEIQSETTEDNELMSGKYIITTLSHDVSQTHKFLTTMTLVKDDVKGMPGSAQQGGGDQPTFNFGKLF